MRRLLLVGLTAAAALAAMTASAQAVVVDMSQLGRTSVAYNPADQNVGVALVPGTRSSLATAGVPTVTSSGPCTDPALAPELSLPSSGLCSHGGPVMHGNETFAVVWDPNPHTDYAAPYVERYLRDVADASGKLGSPYAVTTQYTDGSGRAGNSSLYGGGWDDGTSSYPTSDCPVSGIHHYSQTSGGYSDVPNDVCLTDATLRTELAAMTVQHGLTGRIQPGYTPLLVLLTPPGVVTCLDSGGKLCSANSSTSTSPAQFCSYHSQIAVAGTLFDYVVQPWSPQSGCDEPDAPQFPKGVIDAQTLITDMGARLVSPLSQSQIAAVVNPGLSGWFALDGSEIDDNGCAPLANGLDSVAVGSGYLLQREFNNAGIMVNDPYALACTPLVVLDPSFVVPSAVDVGDVVEFDGSKTHTTLLVPNASYRWDFGDGTTAVGPSAVHAYGTAGNPTVTLTVTDRGGNVARIGQTITVLGASGQPASPPAPIVTSPGLHARLVLIPQGLGSVLRSGVALRVTANQPADGIATVSISRGAARRAGIRAGRGSAVVIGRGTVAGIKDGSVRLHVRLSRLIGRKLAALRHVSLTIRLALVAASGDRVAIDAAGRY